MSDTWRCFLAVPIGADLRAKLRDAVERWRRREDLAALRWTDPEAWHLTVAFLGEIPARDVPRLVASLAPVVAGRDASHHATGGIGGFPNAARARVAWYGVADRQRRLRDLAYAVRGALGLSREDPFRGHITLGRTRSEPIDLRSWAATGEAPAGSLVVDAVELMRSHLGSGSPRYETLARLPLHGDERERIGA